jgi:hypothetical protein
MSYKYQVKAPVSLERGWCLELLFERDDRTAADQIYAAVIFWNE